MTKKPRIMVDKFAGAVIRAQDEQQVRLWLEKFKDTPQLHEKIWVMVELLRWTQRRKEGVDVVREVVRRGRLLDVLSDARIRMIRMGELKMNPNPIRRVKGGYQWGHHGTVYPTREGAVRQMRAIFASGYKGKNPVNWSKARDWEVIEGANKGWSEAIKEANRRELDWKREKTSKGIYRSGHSNPILANLPIGAIVWRKGKRLLVSGIPKLWGKDVLVPVTTMTTGRAGTLPGHIKVRSRRLVSYFDNPKPPTMSMTKQALRLWMRDLTPPQKERVLEQVRLKSMTHKTFGIPYSRELAKEAERVLSRNPDIYAIYGKKKGGAGLRSRLLYKGPYNSASEAVSDYNKQPHSMYVATEARRIGPWVPPQGMSKEEAHKFLLQQLGYTRRNPGHNSNNLPSIMRIAASNIFQSPSSQVAFNFGLMQVAKIGRMDVVDILQSGARRRDGINSAVAYAAIKKLYEGKGTPVFGPEGEVIRVDPGDKAITQELDHTVLVMKPQGGVAILSRNPVDPWKISLMDYQILRDEQWKVGWIKRGKPQGYGITSSDAALNRWRQYRKKHFESVRDAILKGERVPISRFREHPSLLPPKKGPGFRDFASKAQLREWYRQGITSARSRNPDAKALYQSFHGVPPMQSRKVSVPKPSGELTAIGRLVQVEYEPQPPSKRSGVRFYHKLGDTGERVLPDKPVLASDTNGNLFIIPDRSRPKFGSRGIIG